jgi:hypothetical protein
MIARRGAKVVPLPTPPASPERRINHDLLDEARKDAMLLLFALDGYGRDGTYTHEDDDVQMGSLRDLASRLSGKLATIGRQAAGEPKP